MNALKLENVKMEAILKIAMKYVIEGLAIAIVAFYVPILYKTSLRKPTFNEIFSISITAALTMFILDYFTDSIGLGARLGAGFGIGKNLVSL
jgi:hypothetical protein